MVEKKGINTPLAAQMGGPYSQAIIYKDMIYISGQGSVDPETNRLMTGTIEKEARMALQNVKIIMEAAGSSIDNVLHVCVYLADIREYGRFNDVYRTFFQNPMPARTTVAVKNLPFGLRIEIDAVGHR